MPDGLAIDSPTPSDLVRHALGQHESALIGYAASILGDVDLARDAVQETLIKLCEQEPGRVALASLKSWLFTVCRNKCLDMLRRRRRLVSLEDETLPEFASQEPQPDQMASQDADAGEVFRFLRRLPENQQEVLRLKFQNDLSYKEISAITGLSVSNVGFLIHTAVKRLRQLLSHEMHNAALTP